MPGFIDDFNVISKAALYALMDDASWVKSTGGSVDIKVEYTNEPLKDELGNVITIDNPIASVYSDDVPGIVSGDVIAVQDAQYKIIEIIPDGDGMSDLYLRVLE